MISRKLLCIAQKNLCECETIIYCNRRCAVSSALAKIFKKKKKDNELTDKLKSDSEEQGFSLFKRHVNEPTSLNFPNERGIENYNPKMPLKDLLAATPEVLREEAKKYKKELKDRWTIDLDKKQFFEELGHLQHGETRKEFIFDSPEAIALWNTGCDADEGYGYSHCELVPTDRKTAIFRGYLSTEVVKDGVHERSGWASMKLNLTRAFRRKKYFKRWASFSHLLVKCRGDGRSYKLMLHCPGMFDITWGNSYSCPLHTHGGPYWQYEKIPFSKFFHTVVGRIQDQQIPVFLKEVSSMAIVLMDRMDGDFSLEIDFIGVCHDRTHYEEFAYETYAVPIFNTKGI
ncbi:unnamed protein product [Enterobius vermicularis]|uniref:CIA30 domain-containing protein n=1 Tax=Enterobius vermicularis TaxID=51028 RepID=A0A0N4VFZ3_ENTVE|nr:unnamed protein product [Enterobius vermicularis]